MKINQNISAVLANDQLLRNENSLSESIRRLSSGLKFNSAKDNPSGVAISYKMQAQINALNRASANATDGTSMVQTIDGAMGEMTDILQRMRELCVQAASDTNTLEDRDATQKEIDALKKEVDRIASDTEFNGKTLLDGSLDRRVYTTDKDGRSMYDTISNVLVSDSVPAGHYQVDITASATHAVTVTQDKSVPVVAAITKDLAGTVKINGSEIEIAEGMDANTVYEALRNGAEIGGVNLIAIQAGATPDLKEDTLATAGYEKQPYTALGQPLVFVSERYGSAEKIEITCDNPKLMNLLMEKDTTASHAGTDTQIDRSKLTENGFSEQAVIRADGEKVTITDKDGFTMSFEESPYIASAQADPVTVDIEVTDIGTLQLQVGANEDQELVVSVPRLTTESLHITDVDVTKIGWADRGITQVDDAIGIVTTARSKMGAYENRLDYAQKSLDATEEDMTNAISRLADTDMAQEMTTYSNLNVLNQASISVLSQANDLPQQVLSLLQG